jgi:hypothetical protein
MRNKTKKNKTKNKNKNKTKNKTNKTNKGESETIYRDSDNTKPSTPFMHKIKRFLSSNRNKVSYAPTINRELETLQSIPRQELSDCNIVEAYKLKEPLKIGVPGFFYGKSCFKYDTPEAKQFLLKNLSANKHVDPEKIIPPKQLQGNCWFNSMFVNFFVSDKGRKFFHFFRHLMIEGKQKNGTHIPHKIRDAFALLNFGVDACLTGNQFAYKLNTNIIIKELYEAIPESYKKMVQYIYNVGKAGNPIYYYMSIINYLNNNSISTLLIRDATSNWKDQIAEKMQKLTHMPHIIVLEIFHNNANNFDKKPVSFTINDAKYQIDSAVVMDVSQKHFCSTITCEGKEFSYDGYSFHKLEPLEWKDKLNSDFDWHFEETNKYAGRNIIWNYTKSYQMLLYYRI